jgi:hypothetical protein
MISRGQMYRQLYYGGGEGITSLDAGAPSIKYTGDIKPQMASAPDPMAELYNIFLDLKQKGQIPKEMGFEQFKQLMEEQTSSQGGIMDMVPREQVLFGGRVNYGLGSSFKKAVKKVTGAVKDVVKSDLGKAALTAAAMYYAPGFGIKAQGGFAPFLQNAKIGAGNFLFGSAATGPTPFSSPSASTPGIFSKALKGLTSKTGLAALGIAGTSVLAGLSTADKEEIDQADPSDRGRIVKEKLRQSLTNLGYTGEELETKLNEGVSEYFGPNMAVGGRVMKAYGDIASIASGIEGLPMRTNQAGINELDLRNTGGFIPPVGIKEKADDIPAMLSNNEFVFTADAVRAAGGGSVEKGAQKMYDLMKSLEGKIA